MKKLGIFLCCQSLLILSLVIGIASVAQLTDKVSGDYYISLYDYINIIQWGSIIITFSVGVILCLYDKFRS